ncbi:hypothetical protein GGI12_003778 [Dipsacomyces acuminosporus]|nr:hypothetical protein GGI12_003778 [Dipsacomyces acuminosporus]
MVHPEVANSLKADKYLWKYVYYDPIIECRKRLRLSVPLQNLSRTSSMTGSIRGSDFMGSNEDGPVRSSRATSISDAPLEEWKRRWWTVTLCSLFNEAAGYFQILLNSVSSRLEKTSLQCALDYLHSQHYRASARHEITRRLFIYVGDIYRYQFMYLPLLALGDIARVDTESILSLARWMYGRAKSMFFDSGRACEQMALLSIYSHEIFDAVFWQMCGLCYENRAGLASKGILNLATSSKDGVEEQDPIEMLVVSLVHAVSSGAKNAVLSHYQALCAALDKDLDEIRSGTSTPLDLDIEFWEHEYKLSVLIAALLTSVTNNSVPVNGRQEDYLLIIQRLAVTVLLRQMLCLKQALLLVLDDQTECTLYPLMSISLWVDIWRSSTHLADSYAYSQSLSADFGKRAESLFACLADLIRSNTSIQLCRSAAIQHGHSCMILPHDISLLGWVSLRAVQRELQYSVIKLLPARNPSAMNPLTSIVHTNSESSASDSANTPYLWSDTSNAMRIAFSRAQILILSTAKHGLFPFFTWDSDGELVVETEDSRRERKERQMRAMAASMLEHQQSSKKAASSAGKYLSRPLRIPDFECWCFHLPTVERWIRSSAYSVVFCESVLSSIDQVKSDRHSGFRARSVNTTLVLQRREAKLDSWGSAQRYFVVAEDELESETNLAEDELPSVFDVPEELRSILSCAMYYAYVDRQKRGVEIVTESEELEFYASWFGIQCVSPLVSAPKT